MTQFSDVFQQLWTQVRAERGWNNLQDEAVLRHLLEDHQRCAALSLCAIEDVSATSKHSDNLHLGAQFEAVGMEQKLINTISQSGPDAAQMTNTSSTLAALPVFPELNDSHLSGQNAEAATKHLSLTPAADGYPTPANDDRHFTDLSGAAKPQSGPATQEPISWSRNFVSSASGLGGQQKSPSITASSTPNILAELLNQLKSYSSPFSSHTAASNQPAVKKNAMFIKEEPKDLTDDVIVTGVSPPDGMTHFPGGAPTKPHTPARPASDRARPRKPRIRSVKFSSQDESMRMSSSQAERMALYGVKTTKSTVKCPICDHVCHSWYTFEGHMSSKHTGVKNFSCAECDQTFGSRSLLHKHRRRLHKLGRAPRVLQCIRCKYSTTSKHLLGQHINVHANYRPYQCTICGKSYHSNIALYQHRLKHQPGSHACNVCGKIYDTNLSLRTHLRTTKCSGDNRTPCPVCGMLMVTAGLRNHMKRHLGEEGKKLKCSICDRLFFTHGELWNHSLTHVAPQDRPYKCSFCSKGFRSSTKCTDHEHTHSGEKPHKCTQCSYTCGDRTNLRKHVRIVHILHNPFSSPTAANTSKARVAAAFDIANVSPVSAAISPRTSSLDTLAAAGVVAPTEFRADNASVLSALASTSSRLFGVPGIPSMPGLPALSNAALSALAPDIHVSP